MQPLGVIPTDPVQGADTERPHQGLGYKKSDDVYATRQGCGASIPDYFSDT
jgi:putative transposase